MCRDGRRGETRGNVQRVTRGRMTMTGWNIVLLRGWESGGFLECSAGLDSIASKLTSKFCHRSSLMCAVHDILVGGAAPSGYIFQGRDHAAREASRLDLRIAPKLCAARPHAFAIASLAFLLIGSSISQTKPGAREQSTTLREQIRVAHANGDAAGYVAGSRKLQEFLNDTPASVLQLMSAQAFAGDEEGALGSFEQFIRMGQSSKQAFEAKPFEELRKSPRFVALETEMERNDAPISNAQEAFRIAETGLIPEDIDYDSRTATFYITSVKKQEVLALDAEGRLRTFARAPDSWPMMALKIDSRRHNLWVTEVAMRGFASVAKTAWGKSAILIYDLDSAKLIHRIDGPPAATFGDMTLTHDGDAIVSDNDPGGVYRVSRKTWRLERLDNGEFVSPQTAAVSADDRRAFVPDYARGIAILDLKTRQVSWLRSHGVHALSGIDGLYLRGTTLLATQNGMSPERVICFQLDRSLSRVVSENIIERATTSLGDPTHGVVVNERFYYIANSGWDLLEEDGSARAGTTPTNSVLMRVDLSGKQMQGSGAPTRR